MEDEFLERLVARVQGDGLGHEGLQPVPAVRLREAVLGGGDERVDTLLEEGVDELVLVGEASIGGADPDR